MLGHSANYFASNSLAFSPLQQPELVSNFLCFDWCPAQVYASINIKLNVMLFWMQPCNKPDMISRTHVWQWNYTPMRINQRSETSTRNPKENCSASYLLFWVQNLDTCLDCWCWNHGLLIFVAYMAGQRFLQWISGGGNLLTLFPSRHSNALLWLWNQVREEERQLDSASEVF